MSEARPHAPIRPHGGERMSASPPPRAHLWQEPDAAGGPTQDQGFRLGYRPHLDGLRALAVLAVLAVHITPRYVPGGWVGVDVFLVLSGFLITALLLQEWQQHGSISLRN